MHTLIPTPRSAGSRSQYTRSFVALFAGLTLLAAAGCGKKFESGQAATEAKAKDWVQTERASPEERTYLAYGRGIVESVAKRSYADFYAQLSSHARARMSANQFDPPEDEAAFARNEKEAKRNATVQDLETLMARAEARLGQPKAPLDLHVHSIDPKILSGQAQGLDRLDAIFAIGNMPADIPAGIRKASLRAKIRVELTAAELAEAAKHQNVTVEELQKDPDFQPYLNLKLVLVEEGGQLRIGYFEFLPPSMMD